MNLTLPILEPHETLKALYAEICAHPGEDTPRLMFADACEEADTDEKAIKDWGRFIQIQFEHERIGPPRLQIESADIHKAGGPDYYQFSADENDPIKIGDRVDVIPHAGLKLGDHVDGLLIRRIELDDWDGMLKVTAKQDEESTPYPKERKEYLEGKISGMELNHWKKWSPMWEHDRMPSHNQSSLAEDFGSIRWLVTAPYNTAPMLWFRKGFISHVRTDWDWFRDHGTHLLTQAPIDRVVFRNRPVVRVERSLHLRRAVYHLVENGHTVVRTNDQLRQPVDEQSKGVTSELFKVTWPTVTHWEFLH